MPTYEYKCDTCGSVFEIFQKITDEPIKECPASGCKGSITRMISKGAGFIFKGAGFYSVDYRSESYKKKAEAESKSPVSTSDSKSDTTGSKEKKVESSKSES